VKKMVEYGKPKISVLGDAVVLVQGTKNCVGESDTQCQEPDFETGD
jgi:hypothetical protein